jgi:serine/threonine protein phosphatase PrpC
VSALAEPLEEREQITMRVVAGGEAAIYSAPNPSGDGVCEDAIACIALEDTRAVIAVADGVGGQPLGRDAARAAIGELDRAVKAAPEGDLRGAILDAFEQANRKVEGLGVGAATTLAAVEIDSGHVRAYHVGDSQILVVGQRGRIHLETMPHSPVGYGVEAGLIDAHEAIDHDDRHLISNVVGEPGMRIEIGSPLKLRQRDTVVVGSDGLFDNLRVDEIAEHVRKGPLEDAARALAAVCRTRMTEPREGVPSKPDDLSFVLYRQRKGAA